MRDVNILSTILTTSKISSYLSYQANNPLTLQPPQNQTFNIPINNTDPIFYYCSHTHHCQLGMVGVINPPSSPPDALSTYASKASNLSQAMVNTPSAIAGGTFQRLSGAASTVSGGSGGSGSATSSMRASGTGASATATRTHGNSSSSGAGSVCVCV